MKYVVKMASGGISTVYTKSYGGGLIISSNIKVHTSRVWDVACSYNL
jgi:hypothetical protein